MSDRSAYVFGFASGMIVTGIVAGAIIEIGMHPDHESRIQALEQSQCYLKQERQHADYKLNVCIAQLRSKP